MKAATSRTAERLGRHQQQFVSVFAEYLDRMVVELPERMGMADDQHYLRALDRLRMLSLRGGKRQRVAFVGEAARMFGAPDDPPGLRESALSIELLQTHLLVHDDLVDNGPTRRAGTSTYYEYLADGTAGSQSAEGMTLLAGNIALFLALEVLQSAALPPALRCALTAIQVQAGVDTFVGQIYDLERDFGVTLTPEMAYVLADYKAARSSALAPLQMGCAIGAPEPERYQETLSRYAYLLGVAGQFRDDYIGVFGDPAASGKSASSDLLEGKRTLLVQLFFDKADSADSARLQKSFGNADADPAELAWARDAIGASGAEEEFRRLMGTFADRASAEAGSWREFGEPDSVEFFVDLPQWGVERAV